MSIRLSSQMACCTRGQRCAHSFRLRRTTAAEPTVFPVKRHLRVELLRAANADEQPATTGDTVLIHYACRLASTGGCVDSSRSKVGTARMPLSVLLGSRDVVEGLEVGFLCLLRAMLCAAIASSQPLSLPYHVQVLPLLESL